MEIAVTTQYTRKNRVLSYRIEIDGHVQPFGAIFSNRRGQDIKRLVTTAAKKMARTVAEGQTSCQICGHADEGDANYYTVDFTPLLNSLPNRHPNQVKILRA